MSLVGVGLVGDRENRGMWPTKTRKRNSVGEKRREEFGQSNDNGKIKYRDTNKLVKSVTYNERRAFLMSKCDPREECANKKLRLLLRYLE